MKKAGVVLFAWMLVFDCGLFAGSAEVFHETSSQVVVREHPKTGKPFVSIVPEGHREDPLPKSGRIVKVARPDYRLLEPGVRKGEIPYEGPVSDRTKIYVLAASLATLGVVGATALPVTAATGSAAGGAGGYAAAGAAVTAGSLGSAAAMRNKSLPHEDDNFVLESRTRLLKMPAAGTEDMRGSNSLEEYRDVTGGTDEGRGV